MATLIKYAIEEDGIVILLCSKREKKYLRVAVLGDMLELGDIAKSEHEKIGKLILKYNVDRLITVGHMAEYIAKSAVSEGFSASDAYVFYDNESVINNIYNIIKPYDIILFKGSRGMKLEEIADFLIKTNGIKEDKQ